MKGFLLLSLAVLLGCAQEATDKKSGVGQREELNPAISSESQYLSARAACNALEAKAQILPSIVGKGYNFTIAKKDCDDSRLGSGTNLNTQVIQEGQSYRFVSNRLDVVFPFSNVETHNDGEMKDVCANVETRNLNMTTGSRTAVWYNAEPCGTDFVCVSLRKGRLIEGISYEIYSRVDMKIKTLGERIGFFTERSEISYGDCSKGKFVERTAVLN